MPRPTVLGGGEDRMTLEWEKKGGGQSEGAPKKDFGAIP